MKTKHIILPALILFALLVRLPALNQSLWLDEAIQATITLHHFPDIFFKYLPGDFHPPVSYILTWFITRILPPTEIVLRIPSVLAGTGMIWLAWRFLLPLSFLSRRATADIENLSIRSLKFVIYGCLLMATAPLLIYYSQEARMYIIAAFFSMWSMVSFWEVVNNPKIKITHIRYTEYFLATGLMMLTHYMTWLLLPVQILFYWLHHRSLHTQPKPTSKIFINDVISTLKFFLPLTIWIVMILPLLNTQLQVGSDVSANLPVWQSLSQFSLKQLALIPTKILIGRIPIDFNLLNSLIIGIPLLIWMYIVGKSLPKIRLVAPITYLIIWLIIPVLIGIALSSQMAIFAYFRFLYITPAFYLLLTLSLIKLQDSRSHKYLTTAVMALFLIINITASALYLFNPANHREDWKSVVSYIAKADRTPYVVIYQTVNRSFWYYDQNDHQLIDYREVERITDQDGFWLIKYAQPIFEPDDQTEQRLLNEYGYTVAQEKHFRGDITIKYLIKTKNIQALSSM